MDIQAFKNSGNPTSQQENDYPQANPPNRKAQAPNLSPR